MLKPFALTAFLILASFAVAQTPQTGLATNARVSLYQPPVTSFDEKQSPIGPIVSEVTRQDLSPALGPDNASGTVDLMGRAWALSNYDELRARAYARVDRNAVIYEYPVHSTASAYFFDPISIEDLDDSPIGSDTIDLTVPLYITGKVLRTPSNTHTELEAKINLYRRVGSDWEWIGGDYGTWNGDFLGGALTYDIVNDRYQVLGSAFGVNRTDELAWSAEIIATAKAGGNLIPSDITLEASSDFSHTGWLGLASISDGSGNGLTFSKIVGGSGTVYDGIAPVPEPKTAIVLLPGLALLRRSRR